jgi:TRAP-type mannitol/chloroaromatic compound transport system permease small subunit
MPKILVKYVQYVESLNRWLGNVLCYGLPIMIFIALFESIARYGFNSPTPWAVELAGFVMGAMFLLGGGYTLLRGEHIGMDALYSRWSPKRRAVVDIVTFSLLAIFLITIIVGGIPDAAMSLKIGKHSASIWGPPLAPIKIIIVVGTVILLSQGVAILIRDVATLRGKSIT